MGPHRPLFFFRFGGKPQLAYIATLPSESDLGWSNRKAEIFIIAVIGPLTKAGKVRKARLHHARCEVEQGFRGFGLGRCAVGLGTAAFGVSWRKRVGWVSRPSMRFDRIAGGLPVLRGEGYQVREGARLAPWKLGDDLLRPGLEAWFLPQEHGSGQTHQGDVWESLAVDGTGELAIGKNEPFPADQGVCWQKSLVCSWPWTIWHFRKNLFLGEGMVSTTLRTWGRHWDWAKAQN